MGTTRTVPDSHVLKDIIAVLLSGTGSCAFTLHDDGFVLCRMDGPQHFAIERLLETLGADVELADFIVESYLDRLDAAHAFSSTGALAYACRIADRYALSPDIAERLVRSIARRGWLGRLESYAKKLCNRNPTPQEIVLLFNNYVGGACYGTSTELQLEKMARAYMPPDEAKMQIYRIEERNREHSGALD